MGVSDRTGRLRDAWRRSIALSPKDGRRLWHVVAMNIVGGLSETVLLVLITGLADALVTGSDALELAGRKMGTGGALSAAGVVLVVRVIAATIGSDAASRLGYGVLVNYRRDLVRNYLYSTWENRASRALGSTQFNVGTLAERTGEVATMLAFMTGAAVMMLSFVVGAFVVHPLATLAIVSGSVALLAGLRPITRRTRQSAESMIAATRQVGEDVTELETLTLEVEAFGVEPAEIDRLSPVIEEASDKFRRNRFYAIAVPQYFQAAALAVVLVAVGVLLLLATDSTASIGAAVILLIRSLSLAQQVVNTNQRITELIPQMDSGLEQLNADRAAQRRRPMTTVDHVLPLRFENVSYSYPGAADSDALSDIELVIDKGESIGVIGPSGAGKSTLMLMILGVIDPTEGRILADGQPISGSDGSIMSRHAVGIVPQSPVLLRGSLADNVRFYRDFSAAEVDDALASVGLIQELGDGAASLRLEPGGTGLSGGQRQRLSIARAIISRPEVLVLDEPTSALDTLSEKRIEGVLADLRDSTALVIVAHRMSTVQSCDRLVVMADGRIVEVGSPAELATASEFYREALGSPAGGPVPGGAS